jgi:DNA recombination protein RmuC
LRERLTEFQQGLQATHTETAKDRAGLAEQIRHLADVSARMTDETQNLTRALKSKAQTQAHLLHLAPPSGRNSLIPNMAIPASAKS